MGELLDLQVSPLVSIVIPSRGIRDIPGGGSLLFNALESIQKLTTYENFEVVLVLDHGYDETLIQEIITKFQQSISIIIWDKPFNFSLKMNLGVSHARGDFILLLNDDVELLTPDWIEKFLQVLKRPSVSMVGCMLYFDDNTIQHAGHLYYKGSPTHIGIGWPKGSAGPDGQFLSIREVSGVTAACAMVKREDFLSAGGFSGLFPGNFNDVDLCLKIGYLNKTIIWTPEVELIHFESKTRDATVHPYELEMLASRWGEKLDDERFWKFGP